MQISDVRKERTVDTKVTLTEAEEQHWGEGWVPGEEPLGEQPVTVRDAEAASQETA